MILVWGFKSYVQFLGIVTLICGRCHNLAAQRLDRRIRKFTLFWIPLFPVKRQTVLSCTFCGTMSALTDEQAAPLLEHLTALPAADASSVQAAPPGIPPTATHWPQDDVNK